MDTYFVYAVIMSIGTLLENQDQQAFTHILRLAVSQNYKVHDVDGSP
jgi:hypothetical protein